MDEYRVIINKLKKTVDAARQEVELAIMFHESWRPAAYDSELHDRIGTSYAAHTFQIIRMSLRRELILCLVRLWDKDRRAVGMTAIAKHLKNPKLFKALVDYRARRLGLRSMFSPGPITEALTPKRDQALELINKYSPGGEAFDVFKKLQELRHKRLAHRQVSNEPAAVTRLEEDDQENESGNSYNWATEHEIEAFYQDNLVIVELLFSLINGVGYDLKSVTDVYRHHAKFFWESARGERTAGHPNYRAPVIND
ncbi:hypothetical protein ACF8SB_00555 [Pseudomonas sp. CJQ_8]|uniref:AbiU2 domain-containing protein n=1 Tax=Pseudomonas sp. CJQ_8 TaxID=3367167 RepID=UPI00370CCBC8